MKKARPAFGYHNVDYHLFKILSSQHAAYIEAQKRVKQLKLAHADLGDDYQKLYDAQSEATKCGAMAVIAAASYLEAIIYLYGTSHIDQDDYDEYIGKLGTIAKWLLLPRICQGIAIEDDWPEINDLKELVKARNEIVHPKVRWMTDSKPSHRKKIKEESNRFHAAAKKSIKTVEALITILNGKRKKR